MKHFVVIHFVLLSVFKINAQQPLTSNEQFYKTSGDVLLFTMPALALGSTLIWKDGQKGTLQFTKVIAGNLAITYALKLGISKERPNGLNNNSFPSGHTSVAFASASFLQKRYGWKVGVPAYLLAGYVGYSRIQSNYHDGWDVLAGGVIGIATGQLFTKMYKNNNLQFNSGYISNTPTFGFTYKF